MLYQDKYFKQDKNSILRAAQGFVEPQLLQKWAKIALDTYYKLENPMGLMDDFILGLQEVAAYDTTFLREPYELLAAIYRFHKGDNQLEFIWDGRSHYEVYAERWSEAYEGWITDITQKPEVYRAILKICILKQEASSKFLFYGIRRTILSQFNVTLGRNKWLKTA